MKLNYWTRPHKTDTTKSLRARTKTALEIEFAKAVGAGSLTETDFGTTHKVTVEYKDGFDLMTQIMTGNFEESPAVALGKPSEGGQATAGASQQKDSKSPATAPTAQPSTSNDTDGQSAAGSSLSTDGKEAA